MEITEHIASWFIRNLAVAINTFENFSCWTECQFSYWTLLTRFPFEFTLEFIHSRYPLLRLSTLA
jgi:hypothetical protein